MYGIDNWQEVKWIKHWRVISPDNASSLCIVGL